MITRWILQTLWGTATDSAAEHLKDLATNVHNATSMVYDYVNEPFTKQKRHNTETQFNKYHRVVNTIKKRQQQRKLTDLSRQRADTLADQLVLAEFKERIKDLLHSIQKELISYQRSYFPLLWRQQINIKTAERQILLQLADAKTLSELKVLAEKQIEELKIKSSNNATINTLIKEINTSAKMNESQLTR